MALFLKILCDLAKQSKFIDAGPTASWLWLAGVGHCRLSTTDGFIHKDVVPGLVPGLKAAHKHAADLVRVGLWHEVDRGYMVNDYLDMNPSKSEILELQKVNAERKKDYRARRSDGDVPELSQWDTASESTGTSRVRASSDSPSASAVAVEKEEKRRREARTVARFTAFWSAYPRKVNKAEAEKAFRKLDPDEGTMIAILDAVAAWSVTRDWTKQDGEFVPHASTWLNGKRWQDQLPAAPIDESDAAFNRVVSGNMRLLS